MEVINQGKIRLPDSSSMKYKITYDVAEHLMSIKCNNISRKNNECIHESRKCPNEETMKQKTANYLYDFIVKKLKHESNYETA